MHEAPKSWEFASYRMRMASPLDVEEERLMTATIGCAIEVHKRLGPGFMESIYRRAMSLELETNGLAYQTEVPIKVAYRDANIPGQRLDLIVGGRIIVELKAVTELDQIHRAQLISYLKTTGLRGGLLINFRVPILPKGLKRIVV